MQATRHQSAATLSSFTTRRRLSAHTALLAALALAVAVAATPLVDARQLATDTDLVAVAEPLGSHPDDSGVIGPLVPALVVVETQSMDSLAAAVLEQRSDERAHSALVSEAPRGEAIQIPATFETIAQPVVVEPEPLAEPGEPLPGGPGAQVDAPIDGPRLWSGTIQAEGANLRESPAQGAPTLAELPGGTAVRVVRWVQGEELIHENPVWAELESGGFVYSTTLRHGAVAEPAVAEAPLSDAHWIDVDVVNQIAVAYEGSTPQRSMLVSTGRPGWETPLGEFVIGRRVEKETMDAATLGGTIPEGQATPKYKIEDVRHTQYFTADGAALHENTWRQADLFGMPGSHGCVSLNPEDAAWLWDWASTGTAVRVHD